MTCSYNGTQEFFRVGYYVNNAYAEEYTDLIENPPSVPDITKLNRHILVEKPRVTKFQIDWEEGSAEDQNVGIAPDMQAMMGQDPMQARDADGVMAKGTQIIDRNDMMNNANLAQAMQDFGQ